MRKYLGIAAIAVTAFLGGMYAGSDAPYCPEEDSCNYHSNTWHEPKGK